MDQLFFYLGGVQYILISVLYTLILWKSPMNIAQLYEDGVYIIPKWKSIYYYIGTNLEGRIQICSRSVARLGYIYTVDVSSQEHLLPHLAFYEIAGSLPLVFWYRPLSDLWSKLTHSTRY